MWTKQTRGRMAKIERRTKRYPSDLTDAEWERIVPLLPKVARRGRKPSVDRRETAAFVGAVPGHQLCLDLLLFRLQLRVFLGMEREQLPRQVG